MNTKERFVIQIRNFNRFYTKVIGVLDSHILNSKYSLVEARVLFEINLGVSVTASQMIFSLNIDKGQLSNILKGFETAGLIFRWPDNNDKRISMISLTEQGKAVYAKLEEASNKQIYQLLLKLSKEEQQTLVRHMRQIEILLTE